LQTEIASYELCVLERGAVSSDCMKMIREIRSEEMNSREKKLKDRDVFDRQLDLYDSDNAVLFVTCHKSKFRIADFTANAPHMLEFPHDMMNGMEINKFMPKTIADVHDKYIVNFMNGFGKHHLKEPVKTVMQTNTNYIENVQQEQNYCKSITVAHQIEFRLSGDLYIVGLLAQRSKENKAMLYTDTSGRLIGQSRAAHSKLKVNSEYFVQNKFACMLFPRLFRRYFKYGALDIPFLREDGTINHPVMLTNKFLKKQQMLESGVQEDEQEIGREEQKTDMQEETFFQSRWNSSKMQTQLMIELQTLLSEYNQRKFLMTIAELKDIELQILSVSSMIISKDKLHISEETSPRSYCILRLQTDKYSDNSSIVEIDILSAHSLPFAHSSVISLLAPLEACTFFELLTLSPSQILLAANYLYLRCCSEEKPQLDPQKPNAQELEPDFSRNPNDQPKLSTSKRHLHYGHYSKTHNQKKRGIIPTPGSNTTKARKQSNRPMSLAPDSMYNLLRKALPKHRGSRRKLSDRILHTTWSQDEPSEEQWQQMYFVSETFKSSRGKLARDRTPHPNKLKMLMDSNPHINAEPPSPHIKPGHLNTTLVQITARTLGPELTVPLSDQPDSHLHNAQSSKSLIRDNEAPIIQNPPPQLIPLVKRNKTLKENCKGVDNYASRRVVYVPMKVRRVKSLDESALITTAPSKDHREYRLNYLNFGKRLEECRFELLQEKLGVRIIEIGDNACQEIHSSKNLSLLHKLLNLVFSMESFGISQKSISVSNKKRRTYLQDEKVKQKEKGFKNRLQHQQQNKHHIEQISSKQYIPMDSTNYNSMQGLSKNPSSKQPLMEKKHENMIIPTKIFKEDQIQQKQSSLLPALKRETSIGLPSSSPISQSIRDQDKFKEKNNKDSTPTKSLHPLRLSQDPTQAEQTNITSHSHLYHLTQQPILPAGKQ